MPQAATQGSLKPRVALDSAGARLLNAHGVYIASTARRNDVGMSH